MVWRGESPLLRIAFLASLKVAVVPHWTMTIRRRKLLPLHLEMAGESMLPVSAQRVLRVNGVEDCEAACLAGRSVDGAKGCRPVVGKTSCTSNGVGKHGTAATGVRRPFDSISRQRTCAYFVLRRPPANHRAHCFTMSALLRGRVTAGAGVGCCALLSSLRLMRPVIRGRLDLPTTNLPKLPPRPPWANTLCSHAEPVAASLVELPPAFCRAPA